MQHEWHLQRNCSITPRQLGLVYLLLCAAAFGVALAFALQGIWFVLAFAALELAAVGAALLHYARHATDCEHIALSDRCLLVQRVQGGCTEQVQLDPHWTRVAPPDRAHRLIAIESRGVKVEVGAFVNQAARERVAHELRRALRSTSCLR